MNVCKVVSRIRLWFNTNLCLTPCINLCAWRMKNFLCVKRTYTGVGYLCIRIFN